MLNRILLALVLIFATSLVGSRAEVSNEKVLGDPGARVTIIEFASLSCTHCAEFHKTRFDWLKENYIDTGKVRFVFRDFPLNRPALLGSMVAHCAEPSKYFA